jgi:hypothetical protein
MGERAPNNVRVIRLTLDVYMTTHEGVAKAKDDITRAGGVFLWGSLPCTAGSPWQHLNKELPGGKARIRAHRRIFRKLLANFRNCALLNKSLGGCHGFEWPRHCSLWGEREILQMRAELGLMDVVFDGCALGVVSHHGRDKGVPILKPWRVATDMPELVEALRHYKCPGPEEHPRHAPCVGADTAETGYYTDEMVDVIHDACKTYTRNHTSPGALALQHMEDLHRTVVDKLSVEQALAAYAIYGDPASVAFHTQLDHRSHYGNAGVWNAMVTTTIHPADPREGTQ